MIRSGGPPGTNDEGLRLAAPLWSADLRLSDVTRRPPTPSLFSMAETGLPLTILICSSDEGHMGVAGVGGRGGGRLAMHAVLCTEAVCRLKPLLTQLADLDALSDVFLTSLLSFLFHG